MATIRARGATDEGSERSDDAIADDADDIDAEASDE